MSPGFNKTTAINFKPLRKIVNMREDEIRVEVFLEELSVWCPVVPKVKARSEHPMVILVYLPQNSKIRTISNSTDNVLTHYDISQGLTIIQE